MTVNNLGDFASEIRIAALECLAAFGQGHIGGSMSICDVLAVLYGSELKHDPKNPNMPDRDRLILSKGHAGPALYAALALKGFFPKEWLKTLNQGGTMLPSHVDRKKTPGVDMTCGSLGQGLSVGAGMALAARLNGLDNYTYVILGDGEIEEGQVWEAAGFARHHMLSHLIAIVDDNKQQLDGYTVNVQYSGVPGRKFSAFGWRVIEVDGHDIAALSEALRLAKEPGERPAAVVMNTIKGRGAPFAEGIEFNHSMPVTQANVEETIAHLKLESFGSEAE